VKLPHIPGWLPYDQVHGKHNTVRGTVYVWPSLNSPELSRSREILVYVPPSLARGESDGRLYPVIYFHDGQNMFDARTSYVGEWHADETLQKLAEEGIEAIAVGIPNAQDDRFDEYSPWSGRVSFRRRRVVGHGGLYLDWLLGSVKPLVDRSFPTRRDREGTGTLGSSLGGLISLYAGGQYPDVFGFLGAMSPSVRWTDSRIVKMYRAWPPNQPRPRIHLDMGGREWRGAFEDVRDFRNMLVEHGWRDGEDLHYVEDRYATHHEDYWAKRLPDALRFLLRNVGVADATETDSSDPAA
jgi:predicted alpha/beta superfamily hydrolase